MKLLPFILLIIFLSSATHGQEKNVGNLNYEAVLNTYNKIVYGKNIHSKTAFATIDSTSILKLTDSVLDREFPSTYFYALSLYDFSAFEYNLGRINIVVATNKLSPQKIDILFPFDYCNSNNFFSMFINREYLSGAKEIANSISRVFLEVTQSNELCCDRAFTDITFQNCFSDSITLNNVINFSLECCQGWLPKPGETRSKRQDFRNTIFTFKKKKLRNIDIKEWSHPVKKLCLN